MDALSVYQEKLNECPITEISLLKIHLKKVSSDLLHWRLYMCIIL